MKPDNYDHLEYLKSAVDHPAGKRAPNRYQCPPRPSVPTDVLPDRDDRDRADRAGLVLIVLLCVFSAAIAVGAVWKLGEALLTW